ncbi:MAG: hypothetical protein IPK50_05410 [Fibrobacterota bacterium]|nr:MAG: hypothetical protein IPK50_05410 [Fibrobacterota bacterium]
MLVDSNAFFGSIGFQYTEIDPIPASLHLRLSRWNSAWCGELGATFRSDGLAIQPSVGLEVIESNYLTIDSVVTITDPDEGMEPAISIDKANRKTGTPLSLAPMASLVIAKTEGKILPWMALTVEYRNSLSSSHPDQSSVGSSETVGYSASGSLAQVIGGLRYRPIALLILATKVGFSSGLGAFRRTSFQTGASLTFTY